MNKFWAKEIEYKAFIIAALCTLLVFLATSFFFWFNHYEIPLAVLTSGLIVVATWLFLYFNQKRKTNTVSLDILFIYLRLGLIVALAFLFTLLQLQFKIIIISPIALVVSYLIISLSTLLAYIRKDQDVR